MVGLCCWVVLLFDKISRPYRLDLEILEAYIQEGPSSVSGAVPAAYPTIERQLRLLLRLDRNEYVRSCREDFILQGFALGVLGCALFTTP